MKYQIARDHCKKIVKTVKDASWKKCGEELNELCKKSTREFYRSVKAMRHQDEPFTPTTTINDKEGNPSYDDKEIKLRWEEYFKDLLNPLGKTIHRTAHMP